MTSIDPSATGSPQKITWQHAVAVDPSTVDVYFVANATGCRRLANVRVAESSTAVTITLFDGTDPSRAREVCPGVGTNARTRVPLDRPLAGRELVDGGTTPPARRELRTG